MNKNLTRVNQTHRHLPPKDLNLNSVLAYPCVFTHHSLHKKIQNDFTTNRVLAFGGHRIILKAITK